MRICSVSIELSRSRECARPCLACFCSVQRVETLLFDAGNCDVTVTVTVTVTTESQRDRNRDWVTAIVGILQASGKRVYYPKNHVTNLLLFK